MAFYEPQPDGSIVVQTDDGARLRTVLDPMRLEESGIMPRVAQLEQGIHGFNAANTVANNSHTAPPQQSRLDALPGVPVRQTEAPRSFDDMDSVGKPARPVPVPIVSQQPQQVATQQQTQQPGFSPQELHKLNVAAHSGSPGGKPRKAGMVPQSKTVQTQPTWSQADMDTYEEEMSGAEGAMLGGQMQLMEEKRALYDSRLAELKEREQRLVEEAEKRKKVDEKLAQLDKHAEDTERAAAETKALSPTDEFFKHGGGAWARVLAGLATMTGAIGQGLSAAAGIQTLNQGAEAVREGIRERAQMLRDEYERRVAAGQAARNAYSKALDVYGTPEMAMKALELQGEAIADKKFALLASQHADEQTLAQLEGQIAQNRAARQAQYADMRAQAEGMVTQSFRFDPGGGGGKAPDLKGLISTDLAIKKATGAGGGTGADVGKQVVRMPDGSIAYTTNPKANVATQEKIVAAQEIADLGEDLLAAIASPSVSNATKKAKAAQLRKAIEKSGYADEPDIGDPGALVFDGSWTGAADKIRSYVRRAKGDVAQAKQYFTQGTPVTGGVTSTAQPEGVESDE